MPADMDWVRTESQLPCGPYDHQALVIVQSYAQLGYLDHDKQIYWMIQITHGTRSLSHLPIVVQPSQISSVE